jgi:hypothetical protein
VVLVPNAALRFNPASEQPASTGARPRSGALSALIPQMRRRSGNNAGSQQGRPRSGSVWILEDGQPVQVAFSPGASDGRMTQVMTLGSGADHGSRPGSAGAKGRDEEGSQGASAAAPRRLEPGMKVIVDVESPTP